MDIRQVHYFLAIVAQQGYTAAARSLFVSQPSLTVAMHRLEEELGVPLFERAGRRVVLSDAGRRFRDEARKIVEALGELERVPMDQGGARLVVATPGELGASFVAPVIAEHRRRYPDVRIDVVAPETRESSANSVASGHADVGFDEVMATGAPQRSGERVVGVRDFVWAASVDVAARGWPPDPADYARAGLLIAAPEGANSRRLVASVLPDGLDIDAVADVVGESLFEALVVGGRGLALLPAERAHALACTHHIFVAAPAAPLSADVVLSWRPEARATATRSFVAVAIATSAAGDALASGQPTE